MAKDDKKLKKEVEGLHKRLMELENLEATYEISKKEIEDMAKFPSENPNPVLRVAKDGKILYSNKACYPLAQVFVCKVGNSVPDEWKKVIKKAFTSGKTETMEAKVGDGRIFSVFITPQKKEGYANLYGYDITLIKEAEENLKKTNDFSQKLISTIPFGMEIVDLEGNILFINKRLESAFGKESLGKKCWEMYKDDKEQCPACPLKGEINYDEPNAIEVEHVLGGKTFLISHIGIEYEGKKAVLEVFQDITERKRAEMLKDEFVNTVSHELRTPLSIVKESVSLLTSRVPRDVYKEQQKIFDIAKKGVDRLVHIINDILDYQKLLAGKANFVVKKDDINKLIGEIKQVMLPLAGEKGLKLTVSMDEDIPKVKFDGDRITQVLMNLVNNAIKFTDKGEVTIETRKMPHSVCVSVRDTGCGIKKDDIDKLFQSFTQITKDGKKVSPGTGLGLTISKKIIDQHGGEVYVDSVFGKGSRFSFSLPTKPFKKKQK